VGNSSGDEVEDFVKSVSLRVYGFDLISDVLPFGRLWYAQANDAVEYGKFRSRSHDAVIRVCDEADNLIETHERAGDLKSGERSCFGFEPNKKPLGCRRR
jgi:hypothetical protein